MADMKNAPAPAPAQVGSPYVMGTYGRQDVVFERGEGMWLTTTTGERYLDCTAGIAVNLLGGCTLGILNFFMWREIWKGADPDTAPGDPSWKQRAASVLPGIKLGLTLAGVAAGIGLGVANSGFTTIRINNQSNVDLAETLEDQFALIALSGALGIAASVVFIMYVRQVAARHMKATREA